jgi:hypothetical protein
VKTGNPAASYLPVDPFTPSKSVCWYKSAAASVLSFASRRKRRGKKGYTVRYRWRLPNHRWESLEARPHAVVKLQATLGDDDSPEDLSSDDYQSWAQAVSGLSDSINVPKSIASILVEHSKKPAIISVRHLSVRMTHI